MADALTHTAEKALRDAEGKIGDDIKKDVEEKIAALKTARSADDRDAIKSASQALSDAMMKIGEAMKTANDNAAGSAETDAPKGDQEAPKTEGETK